jgi:hypothetical protein
VLDCHSQQQKIFPCPGLLDLAHWFYAWLEADIGYPAVPRVKLNVRLGRSILADSELVLFRSVTGSARKTLFTHSNLLDGLQILTAAKMFPDILPAVQHAHDQHAVGLRLVKNHVAVMHNAAQAFRL